MTEPVSGDNEQTPALPEGGLTAYVNRVRADHRKLANGWCSCDHPLCPKRYLLDHIDDLLQAYQMKVQDLAKETARNAELAGRTVLEPRPLPFDARDRIERVLADREPREPIAGTAHRIMQSLASESSGDGEQGE